MSGGGRRDTSELYIPMKFQVRVLSGTRPLIKLFREAEQMAMFVYAQSKTSAVSVKASMFGVCMKLLPYALLSCGLRSSAT